MATAQVDAAQVEGFTKPTEESTLGSPTIEVSAKALPPPNIESPYDDDDEDVSLPDEIEKEEDEVYDEDQEIVAPQIIEHGDDEDEDEDEDEKAQDEEPASNSVGKITDFSEEEGEEDD